MRREDWAIPDCGMIAIPKAINRKQKAFFMERVRVCLLFINGQETVIQGN